MKDLAPEIVRQRLLIEGRYQTHMDEDTVEAYLLSIASHLDLRAYGKPIIHSPDALGKEENQGYDAFMPLIDSGISFYAWTAARFFSVVLFTCKHFDVERSVEFTREYLEAGEIEWSSF